MDMGYSSSIVDTAIQECGMEDENAILEYILSNQQGNSSSSSRSSIRSRFVDMGYPSTIVDKAIEERGIDDEIAILESILTYQALENSSSYDGDSLTESYDSDSVDTIKDDEYGVGDSGQNDEDYDAFNESL
eukprot:Gb_25634 [translate_table: standard]